MRMTRETPDEGSPPAMIPDHHRPSARDDVLLAGPDLLAVQRAALLVLVAAADPDGYLKASGSAPDPGDLAALIGRVGRPGCGPDRVRVSGDAVRALCPTTRAALLVAGDAVLGPLRESGPHAGDAVDAGALECLASLAGLAARLHRGMTDAAGAAAAPRPVDAVPAPCVVLRTPAVRRTPAPRRALPRLRDRLAPGAH